MTLSIIIGAVNVILFTSVFNVACSHLLSCSCVGYSF